MSIQKNKSKNDDLTFALEHSKQNIRRQALLAVLAILVAAILCVSMTVAWYSNILHTSDMVFKAKEWNFKFNGDIIAGNGDVIEISPGQIGVVSLEVSNTSGEDGSSATPIGVNVNITKKEMNNMEMQKRLYFYVDKKEEINGENVSRLYLSSEDGFAYTLYPGNTLKLSDQFYNGHRIYWYWVNDVVGYYFRGTVTSNSVNIEEVIRPVEYDYDNANYNDSGELAMVNGMTATDFIKNLLKTDGYKGNEINTKKINGKVYYQISTEDDYGIWMYLCSENEIKANMEYDASLADSSNPFNSFKAKVVLTGQQVNLSPVIVGSQKELNEALTGTEELIQLDDDMSITSSMAVKGNKVLDLNNNTLTVNMDSGFGLTTTGGSLTVINGTVVSDNEKVSFIQSTASEVYIDDVELNGFYNGVKIIDNKSTEDSHVFITNSNIDTEHVSVWVYGNGDVSSTKTSIVIENTTINSNDYIGVVGNGNMDSVGVDLQITNSTITGLYSAVYHPMANSTMYAYNTTMEGMVGIAIKAGHVELVDCKIHGTGERQYPSYNGSGYTDTGDGIYVEDSYVEQHGFDLSVVVSGKNTMITSDRSYAIQVFDPNKNLAKVVVLEGKFSSDVSKFLPTDGSRVQESNDGMFEVKLSE